jgi:hypothetical protein
VEENSMAAHEMFAAAQKRWGILPAFDPDAGNVVAEPSGAGYGFWAGAPSAVFDPGSGLFYCYHRLRWPLGDKRGGVCRVVASPDPSAPPAGWRTVWEATREQFGANSIERAGLIRDPFSQEWRLYICSETAQSYDRNPATWRIDLLQATSIETLDPRRRRIAMDAAMYGFSHVKDPVVLVVGGEYLVYTSAAWRDQHLGPDADGLIRSRGRGLIALHRSLTGSIFPAQIVAGQPGAGSTSGPPRWWCPVWTCSFDEDGRRLTTSSACSGLHRPPEVADAVPSAVGPLVARDRPVRYVDVVLVGDTAHFYEYARADLAHELRHAAVRLAAS